MCMFICCSCPSPVWWTRQAISLFHHLHLLSGGSAFSQALPRVLYWLLRFQLAKRQKRKRERKKISGASHLHIPICQNSGTWPQSNCTGSWNMKCSSIQKEKNSIGGHLNNLCQALHSYKDNRADSECLPVGPSLTHECNGHRTPRRRKLGQSRCGFES